MPETSPPSGSAPLNGWKDIASYLGRSVRAIQRWERDLALPVHRIRTSHGQTVYAFPEEIDEWRQEIDRRSQDKAAEHADSLVSRSTALPHVREERSQFRPEQHELTGPEATSTRGVSSETFQVHRVRGRHQILWAAAAVAVVAVVVIGRPILTSPVHVRLPADIRWSGAITEAIDTTREIVWTYRFDREVSGHPHAGFQIRDLDGDDSPEVVVPVRFGPPNSKVVTSDGLYGFSSTGALRWTVVPDLTITCGDETFRGPWELRAIAVENVDGPRRTWAAFVHHTWRPSFVMEISPQGQSTVRYVQSGWIMSLADWMTAMGRLLVAGGVLNEFERGSIAFIDTDGPPSASPHGSIHNRCSEHSTLGVRRILSLPNVESSAAFRRYDLIEGIRVVGSDLRASEGARHIVVRLTPDLRLAEYAVTDAYFATHRQLEQNGKLDHPVERCPFITAEKEIHEWTAERGWTGYSIRPLPR